MQRKESLPLFGTFSEGDPFSTFVFLPETTGLLLLSHPEITKEDEKQQVFLTIGSLEGYIHGVMLNVFFGARTQEGELRFLRVKEVRADGEPLFSFSEADRELYCGGGIGQERLFCIHAHPYFDEKKSVPLSRGVFYSTNVEIMQKAVQDKDPTKALVFKGFTSWTSEEIAEGVQKNKWLMMQAEKDLLFHPDVSSLWERSLRRYHAPRRPPVHPYAFYYDFRGPSLTNAVN